MVNNFFQNHELVKLTLNYPVLSPVVIYCSFFFLALYRKKKNGEYAFLSRQVTVELRGVAILLVVTGHIGWHILSREQQQYFPILGQYGVSIFFLLSGYGLTRSYASRPLRVGEYIKRRLSRVMVPYWIVTALIVTLDTVVLDKSYKVSDIVATVLGLNASPAVRSLDYVRWYITVLLLWYFIFICIWKTIRNRKGKALSFFAIGALLIFVDYYVFPIGYAYLSFPFGVFVGLYYDEICNLYNELPKRRLLLGAGVVLLANWLFKTFLWEPLDVFIPTIGMGFIAEFSWLLVSISLAVAGSLFMPWQSPFLRIVGRYSYGIFLLHGMLMVRYDFILFHGYLLLTFWVYFVFILFFSIVMENFVFKQASNLKIFR